MRNEERFAEFVTRSLPSQRVVLGILIGCLVAAILLAGYEFSEKEKAEARVQADEQRIRTLEAEMAQLSPAGLAGQSREALEAQRLEQKAKALLQPAEKP